MDRGWDSKAGKAGDDGRTVRFVCGKNDPLVAAVAVMFLGVLAWTLVSMARCNGDGSISHLMTRLNRSTGGLLALAILALWIHWFVPWPVSWHHAPV